MFGFFLCSLFVSLNSTLFHVQRLLLLQPALRLDCCANMDSQPVQDNKVSSTTSAFETTFMEWSWIIDNVDPNNQEAFARISSNWGDNSDSDDEFEENGRINHVTGEYFVDPWNKSNKWLNKKKIFHPQCSFLFFKKYKLLFSARCFWCKICKKSFLCQSNAPAHGLLRSWNTLQNASHFVSLWPAQMVAHKMNFLEANKFVSLACWVILYMRANNGFE